MHRQMQGRVLDGLQRCQHGFFVPDGAFLDVDLGGITGQGNLVDEVPLHCIGECSFQQRVDLVDRGAGQQPFLLLISQGLLYAVNILPTRGLGKGGIELLDVVSAQFLHLAIADIGDDKVLHHRHGLGVGLGGHLIINKKKALDTGLSATGLEGVLTQKDRGKAYRYYCERVAAHPNGVGCHYFQCYDQFVLGRFDGENYNIGLFDICSRPYQDMASYVKQCSEAMYEIADGTKVPTDEKAESIPMIAY